MSIEYKNYVNRRPNDREKSSFNKSILHPRHISTNPSLQTSVFASPFPILLPWTSFLSIIQSDSEMTLKRLMSQNAKLTVNLSSHETRIPPEAPSHQIFSKMTQHCHLSTSPTFRKALHAKLRAIVPFERHEANQFKQVAISV